MDLENTRNALPREDSFSNESIFEWNNICYSIDGKEILSGVSGVVHSGEVIAIMGGSGAGKSSLLNILSGRVAKGCIEGTVMLNGKRRPKNWVELVGYVEQEDLLVSHSTVREAVTFSARLRLPKTTSEKEIHDRVEDTIKSLGLEGCANNRIGGTFTRGISGGQRKRVSIAIEVVANSNVIFLDEPTSGLDAFNAHSLIETVKKLSIEQKKIVILTIHQPRPDLLEMFDKIFLLTQGRSVFFGSLKYALDYFAQLGYPCPSMMNPADYFVDLITFDYRSDERAASSQKRIDLLVEEWSKTNQAKNVPYGNELPSRIITFERAGPFTQFNQLAKREFRGILRDKFILIALFAQIAYLTSLVCIVYYKLDLTKGDSNIRSLTGALYVISANMQFTTVMPVLASFPVRKNIFIRERYCNTYKLCLAYLAIAVTNFPIRLLGGLLFSSITYYAMGLRSSFGSFIFTATFIVCFIYTCLGIGLTLGSVSTNLMLTQIFGPMILVMFLFFSGNIADNQAIPWVFRWIQYISIVYWMFRGLMQIQLTNNITAFLNGNNLLKGFGFDGLGPWFSLTMLFTIGTCFYLLGMFCIGRTYRQKTIII